MSHLQNKIAQKNGIVFILAGIIAAWLFDGKLAMLLDLFAAVLLYIGMDKLSRDHSAFEKGRLAALLVFCARAFLMVSEWIFGSSTTLALIFSCVFLVPDTLGFLMLLMTLSEGLQRIEKEDSVPFHAEAFAKNVKYYSFAAVTILMATIFSILGVQAFSALIFVASAAGVVFLLMLIYKMIRILPVYDQWRSSGMVNASWKVVREEEKKDGKSF